MTAALEHELSQGGVPRRNGDQTGKFKNINDLANEIMLNQSKNISSIQFYQQQQLLNDPNNTITNPLKNASLLPSLAQAASKTQNLSGIGMPTQN